jgi:LAO/AO transport system kinase
MESAGSTLPTADASLLDRVLTDFRAGNVRGLARAITLVERRDPQTRVLFEALGPPSKTPLVIGITGSPGTGKSTLADAMVAIGRTEGLSVAVLAVDPNSPYTGGAVFGDRIRMQRHALDPGVYIRSMGSRGHLGGLSVASREAVRLLASYGFDLVILETVGVGQSELEVAEIADTTLVVLAPGLGDGVQMIKAGIMEIADIYVVNKADLPGYERTVQEIRSMLNMGPKLAWKPPIVPTIASRGEGVAELKKAVLRHREHLAASGEGEERRRHRLEEEAADLVAEWSRLAARRLLRSDPKLQRKLDEDQAPYGVAEAILKEQGARLVPGAS